MEKPIENSDGFRYERKFILHGQDYARLLSMIHQHPARFTEIFKDRTINNIYFDTLNFASYRDNLDGKSQRTKTRIRWYGELFGNIATPVLELKIKSGLAGKKLSYPLKSFSLDSAFTHKSIINVLNQSELPEQIMDLFHSLKPTLLNRYHRTYFISANRQYRITVDKEQVFYSIRSLGNLFINKFDDKNSIVVELKYGDQFDDFVNNVSTLFPFRISKNSKYVNGIDWLFGKTV